MSVKLTELDRWNKNLEKTRKNYGPWLEKFLGRLALRVLALTRMRTPVRTGDLRRRWQVSNVIREGDLLYVYIINPLEYASYIEQGHRVTSSKGEWWWEGYFMATISIEEVRKMIPAIYQKEFKQLCMEMGIA